MPSDDSPLTCTDRARPNNLTASIAHEATILTCGVVTALFIVIGLQWARPVLMPVALAILLAFLLNPAVKTLHRYGISQLFATLISVTIAGLVAFVFAWGVARQVSGLLAELPHNTKRITAKIKSLKEWGSGRTLDEISQMIEEITDEIHHSQSSSLRSADRDESEDQTSPEAAKQTLIMRGDTNPWFDVTHYVGSAFEMFAMLAFSFVLLVFFLIERTDLRDRIVMLAGRAKMPVTSKALEDITDRISRYIVVVALINGGFGVILTCGLLLIGVPYALLWGLIAAVLRFIPYIGPWIGAIFPIVMSLATSDGWSQPFVVFLFLGAVELITNNVIEPLIFGHMTGVSPTALLISAAFWLYLWGPIGLVISAPFAVCLVVLGKNLPQLSFLYLLLGDKPALNLHASFYQRLMLGDALEAASIASKQLKNSDPISVCDELLVPTLRSAKRDHQRRYLSEQELEEIVAGVRTALNQIKNSARATDPIVDEEGASDPNLPTPSRPHALCCPASDDLDTLLIQFLTEFSDSQSWVFDVTSNDILCSELIHRIHSEQPGVLVISSEGPGDLSKAKYLCKRLRKAAPNLQILVMRCGSSDRRRDIEELQSAGATLVTLSLHETLKALQTRRLLVDNLSATQPEDIMKPAIA